VPSVDPTPLLVVAFLGVVLVVVLITWVRMPAFLALATGSLAVGLGARMPLPDIPRAFQSGVGDTLGFVAMVIGLGTVIGKLLAESGGAAVVSNALIRLMGERRLDWAMMLSGFMFDLRSMPWVIQVITYVFPARYFVSLLQTLFLAGNVWSVILPNAAVLAVFAAVLLALAVRLTRKRIG